MMLFFVVIIMLFLVVIIMILWLVYTTYCFCALSILASCFLVWGDGNAYLQTSVMGANFQEFIEIIFQNWEDTFQTWHNDSHSFFVVGMDGGQWTQASRAGYNLRDAVARCTTQPKVAERHFLDLRKKYGSVIAVDLVNKHGGEGRLSAKFSEVMQNIASDDIFAL